MGDDPLHAVAVDKIVDVIRTEIGCERRVQVRQRNAQRAGLGLVNVHLELRRVLQSHEAQLGDVLIGRGHGNQLVARLHELVVAETGLVLQFKIEAGRNAQFGNRRRVDGIDDGVLDLAQGHEGAADDRVHAVLRAVALAPVFQMNEGERGVLPLAVEAETGHVHHARHLRLFQIIALHLLEHVHRALLGRAHRQLDEGDEITLVFVRQK